MPPTDSYPVAYLTVSLLRNSCNRKRRHNIVLNSKRLLISPSHSGEEPDTEDRTGVPEAEPDSERPEGPEPAAQLLANVRETTQAGNESPAGH